MAWTAGVDRSTGDLIDQPDWNSYLGANGSLNHLHSGTNIGVARLTYVSGSIWQTPSNYLSGKILLLLWNNIPIPTDATTAWITESAVNQITFTTACRDALTGGAETAAGDVVFAVYLISE